MSDLRDDPSFVMVHMESPERDDTEPHFFRLKDGKGKVHVRDYSGKQLAKDEQRLLDAGMSIESVGGYHMHAVVSYMWALCGKRASIMMGESAFPDEDLCVRCADIWPHERRLLFEHPTSYEDEDW